MKKSISLLLSIVLTLCVFLPLNTVIADAAIDIETPTRYNDPVGQSTVSLIENYLPDMEAFKAVLLPAVKEKADYVDVAQFEIPSALKSDLNNVVWYNIPEAFSVYSLGTSTSNGIVTRLWLYYNEAFDNIDYDTWIAACEKEAEWLLYGIKDNPKLGDIEKILLIHDRLDQYCEYDYVNYLAGTVPEESYEMVGVFTKQIAVCAGYTKAFKFLLDKVGIKNYYISSDALNHAWNMVYLDGVPYFIDSTWDDPVWDRCGRAQHNNFMQSSDAFAYEHNATDYDRIPVDTTYDDMYWFDIDTAFQLVGDYIYYLFLDTATRQQILYRSPCSTIVDRSDDTAVQTFSAKWYVTSTSSYTYTSYLCSDGRAIYYNMTDHSNSDADNIIRYDPATGKTSVFYRVSKKTQFTHAFGFYYDGRTLCTDVYSSPNISSEAVWRTTHHEVTYIDPDTCGKGNHLPVVSVKGFEGTCAAPRGLSDEIECHACREILQNQQTVKHKSNVDHIEVTALGYGENGTMSVYCSCGEHTDFDINSLACRDLDKNGEINAADYSCIVNCALSNENTDTEIYDCDIDGDGSVDVIDVVLFERVSEEQYLNCEFCVSLDSLNGKENEVKAALIQTLGIPSAVAAELISDGLLLDGVDFEYAYRLAQKLRSIGAAASVTFCDVFVA